MDSILCLASVMPRVELPTQRVTAGWRWLGADRGPAFTGEVRPAGGAPGSTDFGWRTRSAAEPMTASSAGDQKQGKLASLAGIVDHPFTGTTFPTRPGSRPMSSR